MKSCNPKKMQLEKFYNRDLVRLVHDISSDLDKGNFDALVRAHLENQQIAPLDKTIKDIRDTFSCYVLTIRADFQNIISLSNKETIKNLQRVTGQAKKMLKLLESLDGRTKSALAKEYENIDWQDQSYCQAVLTTLINTSELARHHISGSRLNKPGRHGEMARNALIHALAKIYQQATGKKPTMPHKYEKTARKEPGRTSPASRYDTEPRGEFGGKFWKFAAPFLQQEEYGVALYKAMLRCLSTKNPSKPGLEFYDKHPRN